MSSSKKRKKKKDKPCALWYSYGDRNQMHLLSLLKCDNVRNSYMLYSTNLLLHSKLQVLLFHQRIIKHLLYNISALFHFIFQIKRKRHIMPNGNDFVPCFTRSTSKVQQLFTVFTFTALRKSHSKKKNSLVGS